MNLKKSILIASIMTIIGMGAWELYIRSQGFTTTLDDNEALWAVQRAKLETASKSETVFLGSSRVLFDIQLDEWENIIGKRPIQLASAGSSPLPVFNDIVNKTDFIGTVIVGVTPGLFFSTTYPKAPPWDRAQSKVNHYHDRTYAQRLNHMLSIPLQNSLAFISEVDGVDGINLKELLKKVRLGNRIEKKMPPFHDFSTISIDRNTKMTLKTSSDTAYANTIKRVWKFFSLDTTIPPPDKKSTMAFFLEDAKKFKEKGGNLILLRCPSTGFYIELESKGLARSSHWDELVNQTNAIGYHFQDYDKLKHFDCPEWSHLSASDAAIFTTELAKIMKDDKVLTYPKIN